MKFWKLSILAPAMMLAAACNRNDKSAAADSALRNDLSLANQVSPNGTDSISALESGYAPATGTAASNLRSTSSGTRTASSSTRRSSSSGTTTRRRTSSSSGSGTRVSTTSGGNVTSAPAPAPTVVKHTKRDAAIGAAAGAVIGGATSRSVKGAVVGGVVGGVLGAVIGNNVDKTKKP